MTAGAGDASKFDQLAGLNAKLQELAAEREALEHEWLEALEVLGE